MELRYCEQWFRAQKRMIRPLTEDHAKQLHESRGLYTVVCGTPQTPDCFIEIKDDYLGVGFLDSRLREYLSYTFEEVEPGRVFLGRATYREFRDTSDQVAHGTTYYFDRTGAMCISRERFDPPSAEKEVGQAKVDALWEPYPEFGKYSLIVKKERLAVEPVAQT